MFDREAYKRIGGAIKKELDDELKKIIAADTVEASDIDRIEQLLAALKRMMNYYKF